MYEGTLEYEPAYIQRYVDSPECVFVLAFNDGEVAGASTAQPLVYELDAFKEPFERNGYCIGDIFYLAESVLLQAYRGFA